MEQKSSTSSKIQVAIQGGAGAFHEIAARNHFNANLEVIPCDTFEELINQVSNQNVTYGIMAIENTVAGSLIPNYVLLRENPVKVIGEEYLRIKQNLVALPGQKVEDISEVHSHYMAIAQTRKYFASLPHIRLVESIDTALSAKEIQDKQIVGRAAIASKLAAEKYGLEILAHSIETNKKNYTRFLVITHRDTPVHLNGSRTKASVSFSLPDQPGSLSQVLSVLAFYGLSLSKIQSMPIVGRAFEYFFHIDLLYSDYNRYQQALEAIRPLITDLQILGEYAQGLTSFQQIHKAEEELA